MCECASSSLPSLFLSCLFHPPVFNQADHASNMRDTELYCNTPFNRLTECKRSSSSNRKEGTKGGREGRGREMVKLFIHYGILDKCMLERMNGGGRKGGRVWWCV